MFFTMHPAYRKAAWKLVMAKCECDVGVHDDGFMSAEIEKCRYHENCGVYGRRVVARLVRLWLRRDKAPDGVYRKACQYMEENWGNVPLDHSTPAPKRNGWKFMNQVAALRELARRHPDEYQGLMEATAAEEVIRR